jgi:uncharacterized cupredoxin-like copper-binding protein
MRPKANRAVTSLAVLAIGVVAAGCGNDNSDTSTTQQKPASKPAQQQSSSSGSGTLQLAADPSGKIAFDKTSLSAKAGKTTIDFQNASQIPHAVEVEGNGLEEKKTQSIQGGKATLSLGNLKPGKYEFYCPVDSHKQQGMKGTLTVK